MLPGAGPGAQLFSRLQNFSSREGTEDGVPGGPTLRGDGPGVPPRQPGHFTASHGAATRLAAEPSALGPQPLCSVPGPRGSPPQPRGTQEVSSPPSVQLPSKEVRAHAGQRALSPRRLWNSGHKHGTSLDLTVGLTKPVLRGFPLHPSFLDEPGHLFQVHRQTGGQSSRCRVYGSRGRGLSQEGHGQPVKLSPHHLNCYIL